MPEFFSRLFSNEFMPHRMCFLNDAAVLWLQVISDSVIALSYYLIPILLFRFGRARRDITFKWIFVAFGMFILACGTTHLLGVVTVFDPMYRFEGVVKAITALASAATFLLLIPMMPTLIALPSPAVLEAANRSLEVEIRERRSAEEAVRGLNAELERRVSDRTTDLQQALTHLQGEMKERQDLQKQLLQSQKMEAVGRLAGGVAHDFNNLLTVVLGYTEMLLSAVQGKTAAEECAREVQRAAERASALTNQLLAFSRQQAPVIGILDVNEAVRHTEKMLGRLIGEDVELKLNLAADPAWVNFDPSHLDQLLLNLAVNARDAMPHGGTLTIETTAVVLDQQYAAAHPAVTPGPHVVLIVSDTGTGMDEAIKARIFEPFFTTKDAGKGTGLGLSIVYGIVKQNGGEILVYSEPGHGTAFKIYVPAATPLDESPELKAAEAQARSGGETILLVEDDSQLRTLARAMLVQQGYRVIASTSPAEALQTLAEQGDRIALLITDIIMPQMNGAELAAKARAGCPRLPVLLMSGYTESGTISQGMLPPDTPFLRKPFTSGELRKKVQEALRPMAG